MANLLYMMKAVLMATKSGSSGVGFVSKEIVHAFAPLSSCFAFFFPCCETAAEKKERMLKNIHC